MSARPLFVSAVLCLLFNGSQPLAADQLPQVLLAPPMGRDGVPMIVVPAGSFPMGVPQGDRDGGRDEYPRHDV
ncbi:MAG: formylglycine-generating enzyme family protein, partial [Nitrospiraceae bacterium]